MTISLEEHVARAIRPLRATFRRARGANSYEYFVLDPDDESLPAGKFSAGPFPTFDEARHEAKLMNARAAIAAVRERGGTQPNFWQPISTAPKDGTLFVALSQDTAGGDLPPFVSLCAWHPDAGFCTDELREPTHWMAIPNLADPFCIRESERAACEAIARGKPKDNGHLPGWWHWPEIGYEAPAEGTESVRLTARLADAIAARKGNGK